MSKPSRISKGAGIGMLLIAATVGYFGYQWTQASSRLSRADEIYVAGSHDEAVRIYEATYFYLSDADKREPLRRIVEYHLTQRNQQEAETWVRKGVESELSMAYTSPEAQRLADRCKLERTNRLAEETARRQQLDAESKQQAVERADETQRDAKKSAAESDLATAITIAQDRIEKSLKYPLDASFSLSNAPQLNDDGSVCWIFGTVEAKNPLGGTHTYPWKANLSYDGSQWELTYCELNGQPVHMNAATANALNRLASNMSEPVDKDAERRSQEKQRQENLKRLQPEIERQQREASSKNRPAIAANHLRLAGEFLEKGDKSSGEKLLRRIVSEYADTDAATEAKRLLGSNASP
ncbi:MAG: hypothetical protein K8U03_07755 [Planctomycetia bacterium]|nr:hypothetical protein [Planctomycetia bacterium]